MAATRPSPRPPSADAPGQGSRGSVVRAQQATSTQLVASAGSAIVSAARVGRILGRSGWRIARQLPGANIVEQQAQRIGHVATSELRRLLDVPQQLRGTAVSPEEQRVMMLVRDADSDPAPLRTAMSELLSRAGESTAGKSREYLFGTIVSQLVPDEARVLAALASGERYAAVDVVAKHLGRSATRTVFANASLIGAAADVTPARNVATYLSRLEALGLVEFGPASDDLDEEYDRLAVDRAVQDARARIGRSRMGSAKLIRKSVALSALGREFWAACAPEGGAFSRH